VPTWACLQGGRVHYTHAAAEASYDYAVFSPLVIVVVLVHAKLGYFILIITWQL